MFKKIDMQNLPVHIGIIMDGNGRWAKKRMLPRIMGHRAGVDALKRVTKSAKKLGIKAISYFAFSTENWKRSKEEVYGIFDLILKHLKENYDEFVNGNTKIMTMGDISKLPKELYELLLDVTEKTKNNTDFVVNIALNYGSRSELARAFTNLAKKGKVDITVDDIKNELYTANLPDPDLIIRTSGEKRLSNFMLFQSAYSELYFPKIHWPDFDEKQLKKAIIEYQSRDRRFGNVKQEKN